MQQWWYMRINLSKLQKLTICQKGNLFCQAVIISLSVDVHKFGLLITAIAKMKFQLRFWQIYMYKVTTTRTLMRRAQLVCDLHSRLQNGTVYLNHLFKAKTTTTQTLLDGKPTVTPIPTLRLTLTLPLLQQWLYHTSEPPMNLSYHILQPYDIHVAHKLISTLLWLPRTRTDMEQCTRSNAVIARSS